MPSKYIFYETYSEVDLRFQSSFSGENFPRPRNLFLSRDPAKLYIGFHACVRRYSNSREWVPIAVKVLVYRALPGDVVTFNKTSHAVLQW